MTTRSVMGLDNNMIIDKNIEIVHIFIEINVA